MNKVLSLSFYARALLCAFCLTVLSACQSSSSVRSPFMNGLLLAEPEEVSARSQIAIARYTHVLYQAKLTDSERAEYLFQRGIAYDSIGLSNLARVDYLEAIKLNPTLAEAHNSVGVHYIQAGLYMQAYESFDASLELNPNYEYAVLNRGIALYYGGRIELASKDTSKFLANDKDDPYRVLWRYITYRKVNPEDAIIELRSHRQTLSSDKWATSLVDLFLENGSESKVISSLLSDVKSQTQLNQRLCEAYFYLGKYNAEKGAFTKAENYFKLALSTNIYEFVEHKYARIELTNLRQERRQLQ